MAFNSLHLEEADLELLEQEARCSSSEPADEELPENSHLSPMVASTSGDRDLQCNIVNVPSNWSNCCVCVTSLLRMQNEFGQESFSYFDPIDLDFIEGEKLFKILDIHPLIMDENEAATYPICKPCYIEIGKYEKLQTEIQRIVDQIVMTVLENLAFQSPGGPKTTIMQDNPNPLESLKDLIFERWKPKESQTPNKSSSTTTTSSSSIIKAIFQALQLQPNEVLPTSRSSPAITEDSSISLSNLLHLSDDIIDIHIGNVTDDFRLSKSSYHTLDSVQGSLSMHDGDSQRCEKRMEAQATQTKPRGDSDKTNVPCSTTSQDGLRSTSFDFDSQAEEKLINEDSEKLFANDLTNGQVDDENSCDGSLKSHTDRRGPFICVECKKEFRQQRDLDVHNRRQHTGERPFKCESCGKTYPAKSALRHHQKIHSQRFVCDICGAAVVTETGLKKHMQIHGGTKQFYCEICSKSFMWKQSLLKHQVLHTDSKPYSCQICERSFPIRDYLDKHMGRRHPERREGQVALLECPYCEFAKFRTPGNLSAHILRKHSSASASFV